MLRASSFQNAFRGIIFVLRNEKNFRIELIIASFVIIGGFFFKISIREWVLLFVTIFFVLILEMINSVIEYLCDFVNPDFHIRVQIIKDVSAGFVLLGSILSIIVGTYIFYPYILNIIHGFL